MPKMVSPKKPEEQTATAEAVPTIEWGKIDSTQDARIALEAAGIPLLSSATLFGDGADFIKDKNKLIGVPFLVLGWHFIFDDKKKREYVNVLIMSGNGEKARFNDGSTGVYAQLKKVTEEYGSTIAITCKFGLRRSDYTTPEGEPASTFYLSA